MQRKIIVILIFIAILLSNGKRSYHSSMTQNFSVYIASWNVHGENPKCDLHELLGLDAAGGGAASVARNKLPDVFGIGFQELPLGNLNYLVGSTFFSSQWIDSVKLALKPYDYVQLKAVRMVGIMLILFTKRELINRFRGVEMSWTKTGLGDLFGNKGAVSIRFNIDGVSLVFVASHLSAHDNQLDNRIQEYNSIIESQTFKKNPGTINILSHDYVFWFGDLNFRLDDLSAHEIHTKVQNLSNSTRKDRFEELFRYDQLTKVRSQGKAFSELSEEMPSFAPTYKFIVNSDNYDFGSRKPAWTDRILFNFISNSYDFVTLDLRQTNYKSYPQYKQSDHKPVTSLFNIRTMTQSTLAEHNLENVVVTFSSIVNWKVLTDSTAWYTVKPNNNQTMSSLSSWDWIGLYRADFNSIDDFIAYEWVSVTPTRFSPPETDDQQQQEPSTSTSQLDGDGVGNVDSDAESSSSSSSSRSSKSRREEPDSTTSTDTTPWFKVIFPDHHLLLANSYRLVYVTENGDVLGMSEPFDVKNN